MSRGKGASTPSLSNRDAVELFRRVDISQLGHVFRRYLPDSDPQQKGAQRLRMHCVLPGHPDHQGRDGQFARPPESDLRRHP